MKFSVYNSLEGQERRMSMNFIWTLLAAGSGIPDALLNDNQTWDKIISIVSGNDSNSNVNHADVVRFYQNWDQFLGTKKMVFVQLEGFINTWVVRGLYHFAHALENVFNAVLRLFGIFGTLNDGDAGKLYKLIVALAFIVLTIGLSFIFIEMMIKAKTKFHDVIQSMIVTIAVCVMLPFGINLFGQFVLSGTQDLEAGYHSSKQIDSITIEPIQNNVVDVLMLTQQKFNTNPKTIGEDKNPTSDYNNITANNLDHTDFGEIIASDNLNTLPGRKQDKTLKKVDNVFKHQLKNGVNTKKNGTATSDNYYMADATLPAKQTSETKAFSPVRARYSGHWIMIYLLLITIGGMFGFIAFRVGKSWYEIFMLSMLAPLMGLQDLHGNQRIKEILMAIQGSFVSVFTEVIGLRVFMILIQYLSNSNNPALIFLKKQQNPAITVTFFTIIMYLACFMALLSGINMVERWTGVPQGHHDGLMGFMMGSGSLMKGAGFIGNKAKEASSAVLGKENGILRDDSLPGQRRKEALNRHNLKPNPADDDFNDIPINKDNDGQDNPVSDSDESGNPTDSIQSDNVVEDGDLDQSNDDPTNLDIDGNDGENRNYESKGSNVSASENPSDLDQDLNLQTENDTDKNDVVSNMDTEEADNVPNPASDFDGSNENTEDTVRNDSEINDSTGSVPNPAGAVGSEKGLDTGSSDQKYGQDGDIRNVFEGEDSKLESNDINSIDDDSNEDENKKVQNELDEDSMDSARIPNVVDSSVDTKDRSIKNDTSRGKVNDLDSTDNVESGEQDVGNDKLTLEPTFKDFSADLGSKINTLGPNVDTNEEKNSVIGDGLDKKRFASKANEKLAPTFGQKGKNNNANALTRTGDTLENIARKGQSIDHGSEVNPPEIEVDDSIY